MALWEPEAWQKERQRTGSHINFVDLLEADTGVPRDCLPAVMDDRVGWRKSHGGSTEVHLVVVVVVVVVVAAAAAAAAAEAAVVIVVVVVVVVVVVC